MSKFTPDAASEFLWAVEMVVKGILLPDLRNGPMNLSPFEGEQSYEVALNMVQDIVKEDWVLAARVLWLQFGIERWQAFIKMRTDAGVTGRVDHFAIERELGVRLNLLAHYIQTKYVGKYRNGFMDDFVGILKWLHEHHGDKVHFSSWINRMLKRRTGLERENDPYADKLSYSLLCKHFGVSE